MNLTAYNNLIQPISEEEKWNRRIDKDKLIDLGNGEYRYDGDLDVHDMGLKSLTEIPYNIVEVTGYFWCGNNKLTDLVGCPQIINDVLSCSFNKLSSLKGCPKKVGYLFSVYDNHLTTLEDGPEEVGGDYMCGANLTSFTIDYVRSLCNVKGEIHA